MFTDGEEKGDLGAAAFVAEHPLASDVRLALNFEAMAAGGPSLLYFTSRDNGWLVSEVVTRFPMLKLPAEKADLPLACRDTRPVKVTLQDASAGSPSSLASPCGLVRPA